MKPFRDLKFKKQPNNLPMAAKRFENDFEIEVCRLGADAFTLRIFSHKGDDSAPVFYSPLQIIGMVRHSYSSSDIKRAIYKISRFEKNHQPAGNVNWYLNSVPVPVFCN